MGSCIRPRWIGAAPRLFWLAALHLNRENGIACRFPQAGSRNVAFERFPLPYRYLNAWGHVVMARA